MAVTITASSILANHSLKIKDDGVVFQEPSAFGSKHTFAFDQIECVLLSPNNLLSFQVGKKVFSIPVRPDKPKHQEAIRLLLEGVHRSVAIARYIPSAPVSRAPELRR